jgi:gliding motility-associated-like protein
LLIVDLNGCRDSTSVIINVFTATADFLLSDSFSTCPPLIVNITNKSTNYAEHFWDFGDGGNSALRNPSHIYSSPGIYTVTLLVKNNGGCTDTLVKSVEILGPKGLFTYTPTEVCKPAKINYELKSDNTVKYVWDFNDGTTVLNRSTTISHIYTTAGRFVPKVILEDTSGCKVALTGTDTVKVNEIETHILSDASLLCDSGYITFRDSTSTNDVLSSLLWNFGDGVKSDLAAPTHKFADTGNYTITLTATSKLGCTSTEEISSYIMVVNSPDVEIMGDTSVCQSGFLELSAASLRVDTSGIAWAWDFGNGQTSTLQYPESQRYSRAGSYLVTVKGTNSDGCTTIARKAAIIHPLPVVDAGEDTTICRLDSLLLQATGAAVYTWKSDPSLTCTNCQSPVARPDTEVTYRVTGKTVFGCADDDSITVLVKQPFNMIVANTDTVCAGESIVLNVTGADFYTWTPSLFLNNANISAPTSTPATSITYQVTGKDSVGCFSETASITLKVVAKPTIEITNGENITIQIGSDVKIGTQSSSDVTSWSWYPPQWLNCGTCPEPTTSAKDNITYNVTAKNEGNCEAQDKVTVNVICNNSNVFLPNTFSPNADGMNDQFYPRGVGLYNIKSFKIFDRWGQLVFTRNGISANNAADGWDGTRNGVKLPIDVYVYILEVLCLNNIVLPFKGNVSLIR